MHVHVCIEPSCACAWHGLRCVALEAQLEREAHASQEAAVEGEERAQLLEAVSELRREKAVLRGELEEIAKLTSALGVAMPSALVPFGEA